MLEWFDSCAEFEIAEFIYAHKKLFQKFKNLKLHTDEENCSRVKYQVQNLIRKKKKELYETNLRQKINKPKELWKTLKSVGLPSKAVTASNIKKIAAELSIKFRILLGKRKKSSMKLILDKK